MTDVQEYAESAVAWQERAEAAERRACKAEVLLSEADGLLGMIMQSPAGFWLHVHNDVPKDMCKGWASGIETFRGVYRAYLEEGE